MKAEKKSMPLIAMMVAAVLALSLALVGCGGTTDTPAPSTTDTDSGTGTESTVGYTILDEEIAVEHYAVGFRMDDTDLRDAVEYTLVEMYEDGTVEKIAKEYASEGINYDAWCLTSTKVSKKPEVDKTTFIVGFDQDFPPYGYLADDGSFTGFDLDMAAEVAKRNGWEIQLTPINWDVKDAELNSGNIDCIWNGFTMEGREGAYLFTEPYMDNTQVIVVRDDSGIKSLSDLEGKIVMAQANSAALTALEEEHADLVATFTELRTIPEYNTAFLELDQGSVDAVAIDLPVAEFQIANRTK